MTLKKHRLRQAGFGGVCAAAGVLAAAGASGQAQAPARQRLSPDLLQTLGVGSRSIALGNAYSAIADDASATFWNPARLGFVARRREFMLEYRPVINSQLSQQVTTNLATGNSLVNMFQAGNAPGNPQVGFAGYTFPLTTSHADKQGNRHADYLGTIGLSYTVGGYNRYTSQLTNITNSNPALPTNTEVTSSSYLNQLVRNSFITLAYGKDFAIGRNSDGGKIGAGLGIYYANQEFSATTRNHVTVQTGGQIISDQDTGFVPDSEHGHGVGIIAGFSYDPVGNWNFGLTYRSGTSLTGLGAAGQAFNTELPDRFSLGSAYYTELKNGFLTISTEVQIFTAANRKHDPVTGALIQVDQRRAAADFHFGMEYTMLHGNWSLPLRLGFHTLSNAAPIYTFYDNVASFGFALQKKSGAELLVSFEPTVEVLTSNGLTLFTFTGRVTF